MPIFTSCGTARPDLYNHRAHTARPWPPRPRHRTEPPAPSGAPRRVTSIRRAGALSVNVGAAGSMTGITTRCSRASGLADIARMSRHACGPDRDDWPPAFGPARPSAQARGSNRDRRSAGENSAHWGSGTAGRAADAGSAVAFDFETPFFPILIAPVLVRFHLVFGTMRRDVAQGVFRRGRLGKWHLTGDAM